jgi:glycosyltransferase involved in cell wall biosynthesis
MVTEATERSRPSVAAAPRALRFAFRLESADFARELRRVAAENPSSDIVLVAEGAILPFLFEERLRKAAYASPSIAAAVPMCDVSPLYSLVDEERRPLAPDDAVLVDRSAYCMGLRGYYEVPRIHPVCAYLRGDALEPLLATLGTGPAQETLDRVARAWTATGRASVLVDYLYVGFDGAVPAAVATLDRVEEKAFAQHHPLAALRRAVAEALREGLPPVSTPGLDSRPVQLHVMHYWGGGLDRWVRDFGRAGDSRVNLVLATYRIGEDGGQRVVLYSDPAALIPVRTWDIARAIRSSATASLEYREILEQVVREYDVEAVIVSSLIGHSLDALALPVKTVVVCHDYYPVCQAINPQFHGTCERCTVEDLAECERVNPLNRIFVDQTSAEWHQLRTRYVDHLLERHIEVVVPTRSVEQTLKRIEPRLAAVPMHVIAHGVDMEAAPVVPAPRAPGERLRLVVLGRLSLQKGMELLREAAAGLDANAEITIVGGGGNGAKLAAACGWKCIEKYSLDELPALMAELAPHAAILPSIVPETFSYTLSELWALGVPPIATNLGSFRERIVEGESGFLFEPNAKALVDLVARLRGDAPALDKVARGLALRPPSRGTAEMVAAYHELLPLVPRPEARFAVGIGRESALTEPYRHLNAAYVHLSDAYEQVGKAYESTREAERHAREVYDHTRRELDEAREVSREAFDNLSRLHLRTRWWRAPRAAAILGEWHRKLFRKTEKDPQ